MRTGCIVKKKTVLEINKQEKDINACYNIVNPKMKGSIVYELLYS